MRQAPAFTVCMVLLLVACVPRDVRSISQQDDKLAEIKARGTLIIATDADYEPQSKLIKDTLPKIDTKCEPTQYTADQFSGFDVAVAVEIAKHLGVEACFVTPPWSQLVAGNWGDNWDIHVGSVAITYERMVVLYFSQPYYATPTVLLIHKDNSIFNKPEDLSGKRVGVCVGCTFEEYLKGTLKIPGEEIVYRIQNAQMVGYETEEPAMDDLSAGDGIKLDAVITILPVAKRVINSGKPVRILGEPLLFTFASVTMDRSSHRNVERLLNEINSVINSLHASGALSQLSEKYQGQDLTQEAARFDLSSLNKLP